MLIFVMLVAKLIHVQFVNKVIFLKMGYVFRSVMMVFGKMLVTLLFQFVVLVQVIVKIVYQT